MQDDIARWDRKYAARNPNPGFEPDPFLVAHESLLAGQGLALDVACGVGHNALFLARRGYEVMAVDASLHGLAYGRAVLRRERLPVHLVAADLTRMTLPAARFDVVVVIKYLDRHLLPQLERTLRPGGLLLYKTFNTNHLAERPEFNRAYLLAPGELRRRLAGLEILATNDADDLTEPLTWWVGRRPGDGA